MKTMIAFFILLLQQKGKLINMVHGMKYIYKFHFKIFEKKLSTLQMVPEQFPTTNPQKE